MKRAQFQDDYEDAPEASAKVTRKPRKKRRRRARAELFEDDEELPKLDAVAAIRSKSLKIQQDSDDDDEGGGRFQVSLRHARDTMRQALTDASNSRIKSLVESTKNDNNTTEDGAEEDGDGDDKVLNETEQFALNINADIGTTIDGSLPPKGDGDGGAEDMVLEDPAEEAAVASEATKEKGVDDVGEVVRVGEVCDVWGDAGVVAALERFRSMGNLNRKAEQYGRAKDERLSISDDDDGNNVRLNYTDEYGRELTAKEAFRLMCHKFHGKGPSKNKRETRLRRELRELRLKQMETDDTPLGSTSALREETRRTGVAHVVISGPQAALDDEGDGSGNLSKGNGDAPRN